MMHLCPPTLTRRPAALPPPRPTAQHARRRPALPAPRSLLGGLDTDGTGGASSLLMVAGIAGAIALSAAPLLTGASARRNAAAEEDRAARVSVGDPIAPIEEEEAEAADVKWGAASVIACIPVLNWLVRGGGGGGRGFCVYAYREERTKRGREPCAKFQGWGGAWGAAEWRASMWLEGEDSATLARALSTHPSPSHPIPSHPHPIPSHPHIFPFHHQAWVFAALTEEDRAPVYWLFAALYAAPALHAGLSVDALSLAATAACAAHLQLERAARTSPTARLRLPPEVTSLGSATRAAGRGAAGAAGVAADAAGAVGRAVKGGLEDGGGGGSENGGVDFGFDPADAAAGRAALPPDMRRRVVELETELEQSAAVDRGLLAAFDERLRQTEEEAPPE